MAKEIIGRQHTGQVPDNPLQVLPNFLEYGEDASGLKDANFPVYLPAVRMDKPGKLRRLSVEDLAQFIPEEDLFGIETVNSYYAVASAWTKPEDIDAWLDDIPMDVSGGSWVYAKVVIVLKNGNEFIHYMLSGVSKTLLSSNGTLSISEGNASIDMVVNMALSKFEYLRDMHVPILEEYEVADLC